MKKIDLTDWALLSERQSTRNYTSPDGKWMVKVFLTKDESNLGELQKEQDLSSYVYSLGISTPKAGGLVKVIGGSVGAVYQNIPGKKSLIRAISEDWDKMPSYIHRFVELGTVIRSKPCDNCLHGDYHPGNYIFSGNDVYAIDLGLFSYGNPVYDWANWYFLTHYYVKRGELFHMSEDKLLRCWEESFH